MTPPPVPRWFWLLPLLAIAAWWPIGPAWQSDDFLALHYAQDLRRALHDFAGPQYGATDIWLFYRPLITLSFWFDQQLGGAGPFVSHLANVFAHGVNALLAGLLWRRVLPDGRAFAAGLWWALLPGHAGTIAWAVGRVDGHTTVWCLAALLLAVRHAERRARGARARHWPQLLAASLAFLGKELAFVVPPLATLLAAGLAGPGGLRARAALALRSTWSLWALGLVYVGFRFAVLGRFGGYLDAHYDLLAMASGLPAIVANALVPMRWSGADLAAAAAGGPPALWCWLAALPPGLAALALLRTPRRLLAGLGLFLVASAPMAAFCADGANVHNLRYFYLPTVALAGLVAGAGRFPTALALLALLLPFLAMRTEQHAADRQSATMHRALLQQAEDGAPSPRFVAGLPHANAAGSVVQLHFGVDRMLQPPFGPGGARLCALRPLAEVPGAVRLSPPGELPFALPAGSTWWFTDSTVLAPVPAAPPGLPDLPIEGDSDSVLDLSSRRLLAMALESADLWRRAAPSFGLRTPGVRPQGYRVTIFTANGYLACLCFDHGLGGPNDGSIDVLRFLAGEPGRFEPARVALAGPHFVGDALAVPATIDLDPTFPVLVEAGSFDAATARFVPTHRARRLIGFRVDRGYAAWVRAVQGR